jgi:DegV family protein with EDD domain
MKKLILTTESVADLPKELIETYNIQIIPMHVIMDGKGYLENEITVQDIYDYYERTKRMPTTTAKNAQEYTVFFTNIQKQYPDHDIVHIGYTSRASGSFQSAVLAARDLQHVYLIDTLNVTGGLATIMIYAAKKLAENPLMGKDAFIALVEEIVPKTKLSFVPDTLEFLKAGGRLGNLAFIGGSLLKIKPCIEVKEGKLVSIRKYRGQMESVAEKLMDDFFSQYTLRKQQLTLVYSVGLQAVIKNIAEARAKKEGFQEIHWVEAGPTISTHAGPGCFGIAGITE